MKHILLAMLATSLTTGCVANNELENPVTVIDPQLAEPDYWLSKPAVARAEGADFDGVWNASEKAARSYLFAIDRRAPRSGLLVTEPTVSAQFFEPWRNELKTIDDIAQSSVATMRRTIYFNVAKGPAGGFVVMPKVLVERQVLAERRVTSIIPYRTYFRSDANAYGTPETDEGLTRSGSYWYAIGRDEPLELALAEKITRMLQK